MDSKLCTKCQQAKPYTEFGNSRATRDGKQGWCKQCHNQWHRTHGPRLKARRYKRRDEHKTWLRRWIWEYLLTHPCVDCEEADPLVLDFDHRSDKCFAVSHLVAQGYALERVQQEVAKCDVRCANCHRRKTADEQNWYAEIRGL